MPSGLMCRSALTAAECSVRGDNLSLWVRVLRVLRESGPGCHQAGIPKPSPPRMRSCESLLKVCHPRRTKGTIFWCRKTAMFWCHETAILASPEMAFST
eukprot:350631-Chlamydomonas_euryale.AAC.9